MPPAKTTATAAAAATPAAAAAATTIGGHVVQILAFIPDNKNDLRSQGNVLNLLADLAEKKSTIESILPLLKDVTVKTNYTRKRFTAEEAAALFAKPAEPKKADTGEQKNGD